MKKIGIIGGVTWASTVDYYRLINQKINQRLGGYNTAEILINSVNFNDVMGFLTQEDWDGVEKIFTMKALELKKAGIDFIAISSNTIAKVAKNVAKNTGLKLVNIIEVTSNEIKKRGIHKVGFLGTGFTMKSTYYFDELKEYGIDTIIPNPEEIEIVNDIIMSELANHIVNTESKRVILQIMNRMVKKNNIESVILGCTEIPLLINQSDTTIPLFDTTEIHANYIVDFALK